MIIFMSEPPVERAPTPQSREIVDTPQAVLMTAVFRYNDLQKKEAEKIRFGKYL